MLHTKAIEPVALELLNTLMMQDYLRDFVLVGGTALALQIGHRKSDDLDLFTIHDFNSDVLLTNLLNAFEVTIRMQTPQALITAIKNIKVDFIRFNYHFIRPIKKEAGIRFLDIEDIAAMKLDAITGRGSKKDFYDLYFLLQNYNLEALLGFYKEKYPQQTTFHVVRSISYFNDAETQPDPVIFDEKISWLKIKKSISKELQKL
jgi:predicted nucleotidyltransferase component of viral defense system